MEQILQMGSQDSAIIGRLLRSGERPGLSRLTMLGATLLALAAPARSTAQTPAFGPLTFEEGGPLQRISYTPMVEGAPTTPRGAVQTDLWMGYSNVFEQDSTDTHELFLDMERLITTTTVRVGVTDRLELGGRLTLESTGGGVLDSFISWWHTKLRLGNANRERYPFDGYRQRLAGPNGQELLDVRRHALALEDVRLFAKLRVAQNSDGSSLLSLRAVTRVPTHTNAIGRESTDFALMALGQLSFETWYLHSMVGASTLRASPELAPILRNSAVFFTLGVERALGSHLAGVVQYSTATPHLRGFNNRELDRGPGNLVFGLTGDWRRHWRWEASFQEDIPADTPAVDFTLGLKLSRRW
jgi:Protein of unknown function (DUF3187)